jgi:hypothetical protein
MEKLYVCPKSALDDPVVLPGYSIGFWNDSLQKGFRPGSIPGIGCRRHPGHEVFREHRGR